jgi:tetratricopeptide (TPR) repeat protein
LPPFYSFELIERICKRKLEKRPGDNEVLWILANFHVWYGKYFEAQEELETIRRMGRNKKSVTLLLSDVYFRTGQYEKVQELLRNSKVLSDADKENYHLGDSLIELEQFDEATHYLGLYLKHHKPKSYIPFVRYGYAAFRKGDYEEALKAYKDAERLNPSSEEIKDSLDLCRARLAAREDAGCGRS